MIRTKDLLDFLYSKFFVADYNEDEAREYLNEIVARLKSYDKLIESIEKLLARVSGGVDK